MRYRQYTINVPKEIAERVEKSLAALKKSDARVPDKLGIVDYLTLVVIPQGVAMTEAGVRQKDRESRIVVTSEEASAEAQAQWESQARSGQVGRRTSRSISPRVSR